MPIRNQSFRRLTRKRRTLSAWIFSSTGGKDRFYGVANELGALVETVSGNGLKLQTIANRGVKVYPGGFSDTFTVDHWRCRFVSDNGEGNEVTHRQIIALLERFNVHGLDVIKTENLTISMARRATRRRLRKPTNFSLSVC